MNKIIDLYHGSDHIITKPEYGVGKFNNDYGLGFYCTVSPNLAKEWAVDDNRNGYANHYKLDTASLKHLNLNNGEYHILNWLAMLLENRIFDISTPIASQARDYIITNYLPSYKDYDIITGYRADDSYFSFARAFLNNTISLADLEQSMMLGELGEQVVIISRQAFEQLEYIGNEEAFSNIYYPLKKNRDDKARNNYQKIKNNSGIDGTYILDILREGWTNDDARLRRILSGRR